MFKKFMIASLIISLSSCATFSKERTKVSNFACEYKDTIVALALSVGDAATANAIDAYCTTLATTPAPGAVH